jgi:hypothetical protein
MIFHFTDNQIQNNPNTTATSTESYTISDFDDLMATIPEELVNDHNISLYFYSSYSYRIWILHKIFHRQWHLISQPVREEIIQMLLLHQQKVV